MATNHRYLDVMTVRSSAQSGKSSSFRPNASNPNPHASLLLIEPIVMPNLDHISIDHEINTSEPCLFYPNGEKNRNIRREIEHTIVKHHLIDQSLSIPTKKKKVIYRLEKALDQYANVKYALEKVDQYANVKGPPIYYGKKPDLETEKLIKKMKNTENKIHGTIQIRL